MKLIASGAPRKSGREIFAPSWFSKSNDGIGELRCSGGSQSVTNAEASRGAGAETASVAAVAHAAHGSEVLQPTRALPRSSEPRPIVVAMALRIIFRL